MTEERAAPDLLALADRLEATATHLRRLARAGEMPDARTLLTLVEIEGAIHARRQDAFPPGIGTTPAWEIFLELARARLASERKPLAEICASLAVAFATGVREISPMIENGLVSRNRDKRRLIVQVTDKGLKLLAASYGAPPDRARPKRRETES